MKYTRMAALILGAALGLGTLALSAQAQERDDYGARVAPQFVLTQWGLNNGHFDHGYRDGSKAGREDAQKGKRFIAYDHGTYRDSHDQTYREGYLRGYRETYDQYARYRDPRYGNHNGSWRDRDDDRYERRDHDHDRDNRWRDRDHDDHRDHDHDQHKS